MHRSPPSSAIPQGRDADRYDQDRRRLFWAMPSGLYLIGSRSGAARNLMTANWATQVASTPKLLAVSVEVGATTRRLIEESGYFSLSILSSSQRPLVRKFVKPAVLDEEAGTLNGVGFVDGSTSGAPIPVGALGAFECRVAQRTELGSHVLFIGEVIDVQLSEEFSADRDIEVLSMADTRMNYGG